MKLKQYIKKLQKIADKYPDATVVYAKDDEGNGYGEVLYSPSPCQYVDRNEVYTDGDENCEEINAVLLN